MVDVVLDNPMLFLLVFSLIVFNDDAVSDWMHVLLPLATERGTCIITNMGASKKSTTLNYFMQTAIGILFFYFPFFWVGSGSTWCSGKSSGNSKQPGA